MALYIPHSIFNLARLLYVRPENFGSYYACWRFLGYDIPLLQFLIVTTEVVNTFYLCIYLCFIYSSCQSAGWVQIRLVVSNDTLIIFFQSILLLLLLLLLIPTVLPKLIFQESY
jgi:hypothetical protein